MKKTYSEPVIEITEFRSDTETNITLVSGVQGTFKTNSVKKIGGGNLIDF
ncbi:MAG: hypothetical protein IKS17_07955 [Firmicutes bacterium]|nr:hypothetical protein [Bacillota bacterium]